MDESKVYPDDLNPFGSEDGEPEQTPTSLQQSTDEYNPFGSSDDEDSKVPTKPSPHSPIPVSQGDSQHSSSTSLKINVQSEETGMEKRRSTYDISSLKPPVAPRRRSAIETPKVQPTSEVTTLSTRSSSSLSTDSQPLSIPTTPTSKVKRRAPPVPGRESLARSISPSPGTTDVTAENGPRVVRRVKKPAPPPPVKLFTKSDMDELKGTVKDLCLVSSTPVLSSGDTSLTSSPSLPKRQTVSKSPVNPEYDGISVQTSSSETPGVLDDVEEQKLMEQLRELVNEHRLIQAELRQLIEIPDERRTEAHAAREEQLMKDLVENVKRREELEYEEETCEVQDVTTGEKTVKKMKKKRKFRIKKLLRGL